MTEIWLHKRLNAPSGKMDLEVNMAIEKGNLVALYGKSGAGKTSILRMIAGLMRPTQGKITVDNQSWCDTQHNIYLRPQQRSIGFLFQDYALFPNMTVRGNLEFAKKKGQDSSIIEELIEVVELGDLQKRKPTTLSGGQQQRVALARALVQKPKLLLLDEPLSALDKEMRVKLQGYLLKVHREYGLTTILVSHDTEEVSRLADQVFWLEEGKIRQTGTPEEVLGNLALNQEFRLTGKIMKMEILPDKVKITLLFEGNELFVFLSHKEAQGLTIGQEIAFSAKIGQFTIY